MKNKYPALSILFIMVFAAFVMPGCKTLPANAPKGFAAYEGSSPFRAVSPDGVMYRVRTYENKPYAELPFWKTALKKHMVESGYRFISESDLTTDSLTGYQLELSAPVGDKDFIYLITLFVKGDTVYIAESSGEIAAFNKHKNAITEAMKNIRG